MQELIKFILDRLLALWPLALVNEWQLAMLVRNGRIMRDLGPGLHWRWPLVEQVTTWARTEISLDLPTAAITTADGVAVAVSANLGFRVVDLARCFRTVWNVQDSIGTIALGRIAATCSAFTFAQLCVRGHAETTARAALAETMAPMGLGVERLHFTDCVRLRAHRLYHDGSFMERKS